MTRRSNQECLALYERLKRQGVATERDLLSVLPPMRGSAGEEWRETIQIGQESTPGTLVTTTRKLYGTSSMGRSNAGGFTRKRPAHLIDVMTGTRDNQRDIKLRAVQVDGTFEQPISADEIVEILLATLSSGVTPTTVDTSARLWTFKPNSTSSTPVDAQTWQWFDGANNWKIGGVRVNELTLKGDVKQDTSLQAKLFGQSMAITSADTAIADRLPDFIEGWEVALFIDAFGGTPGTTAVSSSLINWDVTIKNNLGRKYFGNNTINLGAVIVGVIGIQANILLEASVAETITEYNDWDAATKRLVRLQLGNNELVGAISAKKLINIDIPGSWTAVDLTPEDAGTKVFKFSLDYVYDAVNAFGIQIEAQNARSTAYSAT